MALRALFLALFYCEGIGELKMLFRALRNSEVYLYYIMRARGNFILPEKANSKLLRLT